MEWESAVLFYKAASFGWLPRAPLRTPFPQEYLETFPTVPLRPFPQSPSWAPWVTQMTHTAHFRLPVSMPPGSGHWASENRLRRSLFWLAVIWEVNPCHLLCPSRIPFQFIGQAFTRTGFSSLWIPEFSRKFKVRFLGIFFFFFNFSTYWLHSGQSLQEFY